MDREYAAAEIGHFRAFFSAYLKEPKAGMLALLFGSTDCMDRFKPTEERTGNKKVGIAEGIGSGQWHIPWPDEAGDKPDGGDEDDGDSAGRYRGLSYGSSIGMKTVKGVGISFHQDSFIRVTPTVTLRDFDESMLMPILSHSFAKKVEKIVVYANGYLLLEMPRHAFGIDTSAFELAEVDARFTHDELSDPWVRLRPADVSAWNLSFSSNVPVRMFTSRLATETYKNATST